MAIRFNSAQNFAGKNYVSVDELDRIIQSFTLDNNGVLNYIAADGGVEATTSAVDLKSLASASLQIRKLGAGGESDSTSTTEGYAASYALFNGDQQLGATIDIVKDQFLKTASFGWYIKSGDAAPYTYTESTKGVENAKAYLVLTFNTNTDGNAADSEGETTVYIDADSFFQLYKAGAGLQLDADGTFSIKLDSTSDPVYTASGTSATLLSTTSSGLKISNVQAAIDYATVTAAAKIDSAVTAGFNSVNSQVSAFTGAIVQLIETALTIPGTATNEGDVVTTGTVGSNYVVSASVGGRVLAVYGQGGDQIYPEITYSNGSSVLVGDYRANTVDSAWTVIHTDKAVSSAAVSYTNATYTPAAVSAADLR